MHFYETFKGILQRPGKIGLYFILGCCMTLALSSGAQSVSLSLQQEPIEKAFGSIEAQTKYRFVYGEETVSKARPVTLSLNKVSLQEALSKIFAGQPLTYSVEDRYIMIKAGKENRPVTIDVKGEVMDEDDKPLQGVTVTDKRSQKTTVTDDKGEFILQDIDEHAVLVFSFIGRQTVELPISGKTHISVTLSMVSKTLDETIIQAYGTTTRRLNTGTISKVSAEDIERQPVSNPISALEGRVAGLQISQGSGVPGSFYTIRLRGQNSIANGNDPLVIVDGVPFPSTTLNGTFGGGGGVTNSPLNTIDPATIKSIEVLKDADATAIYGSKAANGVILITTKESVEGKPQLNISSYAGIGKILHRMDLLNTTQYLAMRREAFENDGVSPNSSNAKDLLLWDTTRYTDWQKLLIGNSMHIYDFKTSYSDGSKPTQFLMGVGYHKETTVFPGDFGEEKFSGNFNINHHSLNSKLSVSVGGSFLKNNNVLPQTDLTTGIVLPPDAPKVYDENGNLNWENSTWTNPFSAIQKPFKTTTDNLIVNSAIGYKISSKLDFKTTFSLNRITQQEHISNSIASNNPALVKTGSASFGSNSINTLVVEPQLNYMKNVLRGKLHLLAGYTVQATNQNAVYEQGGGYTSDDLLNSLKAAPTVTISNEINSRYRYLGLFGRMNYDYGNKYLLTATARRDGSSRYGPANRFANFGSFGLGWIFTREKFMKAIPVITYGKIKASYGTTGNDQIGDYKYLNIYGPTTYPYFGVTTLQPIQLFNADYSWERVIKREIGLELGFNDDRTLLTVNYYHNTTTNQLILYGLPTVSGFTGVLRNLPATILNKGLEFELNSILVNNKHFSWKLDFNLAFPKNKLVSFADISRSTYANTYIVGQSLLISRRYIFDKVDPATGLYTVVDVNKDGKITTPADLGAVVNIGQQFFGGLQSSLSYKRFQLSLLCQFVQQKNATSYVSRFGRPGVMNNQPAIVLDRWKTQGDVTTIQKFSNSSSATNLAFSNYLSSDAVFSDASFIRLKSFELSWEINSKNSKQILTGHSVIFVQGQNLLTITGYEGLDPETKTILPPPTIVTFGFRFSL
jgi:TonB-linked SusC/RagA family outer membrane protein